jgi:hypothetical protein
MVANRSGSTLEVAMIVRLIAQTFAMGVLLFLAAGTFAWPSAWAYLVLMVALSFTLGLDLARHDPCFGSAWVHRCSAISRPPTRYS